eukprot:11806358-Alexandrium_andersonii.AAC.1
MPQAAMGSYCCVPARSSLRAGLPMEAAGKGNGGNDKGAEKCPEKGKDSDCPTASERCIWPFNRRPGEGASVVQDISFGAEDGDPSARCQGCV